ncbi:glycosyltransferase family 4 protein [Solibacillus sp. CAU 1738]|uniref:glycosyltransferase family 4 protein n=1 Tax=Solibacillus sp. CAU 1738 TaxID=3140363 RepID=UPI00326068A7
MKKKLLMYAHYYHPDVASTGQILTELAEGMKEHFDITVICVVPSYTGVVSQAYEGKKYYFEEINGIKIVRVKVPEFSKTNKVSRVKNIVTYFFRAIIATFKVGKQDFIYSISQPPILGGILGVLGKWIKNAKYIYNIQDFNPEQTMAVNYSENQFILKIMMLLDKFSCKRADKVIVVGRDMLVTLKNRFKLGGNLISKKLPDNCYINNWTNEKEIYPLGSNHQKVVSFKKKYGLEDKFIFMYSGNIGLYYDLENLIKVIEKFKEEKEIVFAFVGEGTVKAHLETYKENHQLDNVCFIPYQKKADLIYSLNAGDVHWVVNAKGIRGVSVPSKLYGVMAAGRPVLGVLEVGSEARLIIEEAKCGYVNEPGNYDQIEQCIRKIIDEKETLILKSKNGRDYLVKNLTKDVSINKYISEINSLEQIGKLKGEIQYEQ